MAHTCSSQARPYLEMEVGLRGDGSTTGGESGPATPLWLGAVHPPTSKPCATPVSSSARQEYHVKLQPTGQKFTQKRRSDEKKYHPAVEASPRLTFLILWHVLLQPRDLTATASLEISNLFSQPRGHSHSHFSRSSPFYFHSLHFAIFTILTCDSIFAAGRAGRSLPRP